MDENKNPVEWYLCKLDSHTDLYPHEMADLMGRYGYNKDAVTIDGEEHRWQKEKTTIINVDGRLIAIEWMRGLTEGQEDYFRSAFYVDMDYKFRHELVREAVYTAADGREFGKDFYKESKTLCVKECRALGEEVVPNFDAIRKLVSAMRRDDVLLQAFGECDTREYKAALDTMEELFGVAE